jgi:hypothetical protein
MQHRQQANTGQYILLMERRLLSYWWTSGLDSTPGDLTVIFIIIFHPPPLFQSYVRTMTFKYVTNIFFHYLLVILDSSVGIVTSFELDGWGSIPGKGTRFFSSPQRLDRLISSSSLLAIGYLGASLQGKGAGAWIWKLHVVPRLRMVEMYVHSPIRFNDAMPNHLSRGATLPFPFSYARQCYSLKLLLCSGCSVLKEANNEILGM